MRGREYRNFSSFLEKSSILSQILVFVGLLRRDLTSDMYIADKFLYDHMAVVDG